MILTIGVDLVDQLVQDFLVERLPHQPKDIGHHVGGDATTLPTVEAIESFPQNCKRYQMFFA